MDIQTNITYAKRNIIDLMWTEARLEGIAVTFPQTAEIYEGRSVSGLTIDQVKIINNLKHAWQFLFDSIGYPLVWQWLSQLHYEIGKEGIVNEPGNLRSGIVKVTTGSEQPYYPKVVDIDFVSSTLSSINEIDDPIERALTVFCFLCRRQLFWDGNKRTAQLVANKLLIESGSGILSIDPSLDLEFRETLVAFDLSNDPTQLKSFLKANCIDSPDIQPEQTRDPSEREHFTSLANRIIAASTAQEIESIRHHEKGIADDKGKTR